MTGLRDGYAQSPAAQSQQTSFYDSYLGRDPTAADVSNYVNDLENGSVTLMSEVRLIADSPECAAHIGSRWQSELGVTPSTADVGAWQGYFASSAASIDVLDQNLAQSTDATNEIFSIYNANDGRNPTSDELNYARQILAGTASFSETSAFFSLDQADNGLGIQTQLGFISAGLQSAAYLAGAAVGTGHPIY